MQDKMKHDDQFYNDILAGFMERSIKRWFVAWLITFLLFVASNAYWIWDHMQYEIVETTRIVQENEDGYNSYVGNDGDIYYGGLDYGETDNYED